MNPVKQKLEAWARTECNAAIAEGHERWGVEREHYGRLKMLTLLWPVIEAGEIMNEGMNQIRTLYKHDMDRPSKWETALAELEEKLNE